MTNPTTPAGAGKESSCPCCWTAPCSPHCSCVKPFSSHGCRRCCTYGSDDQRRERAAALAKIIDDGQALLAELDAVTKELADLKTVIIADLTDGGAEVDKALAEHGYDSLRFADVRHGRNAGCRRLNRLFYREVGRAHTQSLATEIRAECRALADGIGKAGEEKR